MNARFLAVSQQKKPLRPEGASYIVYGKYLLYPRRLHDAELDALGLWMQIPLGGIEVEILFDPPNRFTTLWPRGYKAGDRIQRTHYEVLEHLLDAAGFKGGIFGIKCRDAIWPPDLDIPRESLIQLLLLLFEQYERHRMKPLLLKELAQLIRDRGYPRWPDDDQGMPHTARGLKPWLDKLGIEASAPWSTKGHRRAIYADDFARAAKWAGVDPDRFV